MKSAFKSQWRSGLTLREQASTRDTAKHRWCLSVFFVLCLLSVKHCSFLPSVTSQQYLRTQHFSFFFLFLFLLLFSEWQQKRFVSVLVVTDDTCVLIKKSLSLPGELRASSILLRVERQPFSNPSTQHAQTLHFMWRCWTPQKSEGNLPQTRRGRACISSTQKWDAFYCSRNMMKPDLKSESDRGAAG